MDTQTKLMLEQDQQDLLALLDLRFGDVPADVAAEIQHINKMDTLQRLILVAANAADWQVFTEELQAGEQSLKIVGERFSPI